MGLFHVNELLYVCFPLALESSHLASMFRSMDVTAQRNAQRQAKRNAFSVKQAVGACSRSTLRS